MSGNSEQIAWPARAFLPHLKGKVVQVLTDNTGAMYYINRQGGARPSAVCQEALSLLDFCMRHAIHLITTHLPGSRNVFANHLCRTFSFRREWSLHPKVVSVLFRRWGIPQVGLIMSRQNRKCHQFCFIQGLDRGSLSDAFLIPWTGRSCMPFHHCH